MKENERLEEEKETAVSNCKAREKAYREELAERENNVSVRERAVTEKEHSYYERLTEEAESRTKYAIDAYQRQHDEEYRQKAAALEADYQEKTATLKVKAENRFQRFLKIVPKLAICAVLCVGLIFLFTYCQNHVRDKNRALQDEVKRAEAMLESVKTNTYQVDDDEEIDLFDENKEEISNFWMYDTMYSWDKFIVLSDDGSWCLIRYEGDKYYIKSEDLSKATQLTVDLS